MSDAYLPIRNADDSAHDGGGVVRGTILLFLVPLLLLHLHGRGQPARSSIHHIFVFRLSGQHLLRRFRSFLFQMPVILGILPVYYVVDERAARFLESI